MIFIKIKMQCAVIPKFLAPIIVMINLVLITGNKKIKIYFNHQAYFFIVRTSIIH